MNIEENITEKIRCEICDRMFKDSNGLSAHNKAKHPELVPKERKPLPIKKIRNWIIFVVVIGLLIWGIIALIPENNVKELNVNIDENSVNIPTGAVHWHPILTIKINGKEEKIPNNIGVRIGKIIDTNLGMDSGMSPAHTHEEGDGTIHLENNNPSSKPETLALGYFFYVWDKPFNSTCIFDYCTDKGELKMYVNEKENFDFENYIMRDKDQIVIDYTSKEN